MNEEFETLEQGQTSAELLVRMERYRETGNWLGFWEMADEMLRKNCLTTITTDDIEATKIYIEQVLKGDRPKIIKIKSIVQKFGFEL